MVCQRAPEASAWSDDQSVCASPPSELSEGRPYRPERKPDPPRQLPPYLGFGSEEDTLTSVFNLIPQAPKKDFNKFMENDR